MSEEPGRDTFDAPSSDARTGLDGTANRPPVATIGGVEVVTIPLVDYAALLDDRRRLAELRAAKRQAVDVKRGRIARDAEVGVYLADCLGGMTLDAALRGCAERFGVERTPSSSAAHRYWQGLKAMRRAAAQDEAQPQHAPS